jgi:ribosome-associated protein
LRYSNGTPEWNKDKVSFGLRRRQVLIDSKVLAQRIAFIAQEKKAEDVMILDMRQLSSFFEYFVIVSGASLRQVNAIAGALQDDLARENIKSCSRVPAQDESGWIVLDYSAVVAHVFYKPKREFYALERLWSDAKRVRISKRIPRTAAPQQSKSIRS